MKRTVCKLCSCVLIMSMLMSVGCKKKQEATVSDLPEEITADMPWYDGTVSYVAGTVDVNEYEYTSTYVLGTAGDRVIFETDADRFQAPAAYAPNDSLKMLHIYDLDGVCQYDIDLDEAIKEYDPGIIESYVWNVSISGDLVRLWVVNIANEDDPYHYYELNMYLDPAEGAIVSDEEIDRSGDEYASFRTEQSQYTADGWIVTEYNINWNDGRRYDTHMSFVSPEGEENYIDVSSSILTVSIAAVEGHLYLGDGKFVYKVMNYALQDRYIYIDAVTSEVAELSTKEDYTWLEEVLAEEDYYYYDGFGNAAVNIDGIKVIDLEAKEVKEHISFDYCDINRYDTQYMGLLYASEDKIVLGGTAYHEPMIWDVGGTSPEEITPMMIVLDRCDENPHAGKKVMSLANLGSYTYPMAEAVRRYNETSSDTIIMLDPRYRFEVVAQDVLFDAETDYETYELQVKAAMMNLLSIDLMAGEGPDLITGALEYRQLNDPEMLLDLAPDADIPDVYGNVIEFAKNGDALYQVPLSFYLEGILADRADVPSGQIGFDFDSYNAYVSGPCNGRDPNRMTKLSFMCTCLAEMSATFQADGGYDYNSDEFAQVASFVNDQILPDELEDMVIQETWTPGMEDPYASAYVTITSGRELLGATQGRIDEQVVMGFPSNEPRGLLIDVNESIAVSASTEYPDQCRGFVRSLVSDEMQSLFAYSSGIPINKVAQEEACREFAQRHDQWFDAVSEYYTQQDLVNFGKPLTGVDADELVSEMNGYISDAAGLRMTDAAVEIIVIEEIQPYFAGQKSIEDCMEIIENRVDLYVNERG